MESIYLLVDPRDRLPHYVGRTSQSDERKSSWLKSNMKWKSLLRIARKNPDMAIWLLELSKASCKPVFVIIEDRLSFHEASYKELDWIKRGFAASWPLLNIVGRQKPENICSRID